MGHLQIDTVRARTDNYCYVVYRMGSRQAVVIDPSEAAPIERHLEENGLNLGLILNTHHHHDHVGGNIALSERYGSPIYCSIKDLDRVPGATRGLKDHEKFDFDGVRFQTIEIPGHTHGQIAFEIQDAAALFVGDTVFAMGCGRLFEGAPATMFASLRKIRSLPPTTRLYFGHEYTETNARFALSVEPDNEMIKKRLEKTRMDLAESGYAEAPTIQDEILVNPFFRADSASIRSTLNLERQSDFEVFTKLRELRNSFS